MLAEARGVYVDTQWVCVSMQAASEDEKSVLDILRFGGMRLSQFASGGLLLTFLLLF